MVLLPSILNAEPSRNPLLILQSSLGQTSLPILRQILTLDSNSENTFRHTVLFCLLFSPSTLTNASPSESLKIYDWIDIIPGYRDSDSQVELLAIVEQALDEPSHSINIIIDSIDTLFADIGSLSETYKCLSKLYALVKRHPNARLVLHSQSPSTLLPLISQTAFSSSLVHIIAHPPALLQHLAAEFLMLPPPLSPLPKFWSVFLPVSERTHDTERVVFGPGGEGSSHPTDIVVELIVRDGVGRKRGVERVLEGWSGSSCDLTSLESLKRLLKPKQEQTSEPDPTQNLSFNLSLTSSQQESRAQVPLPYAHEGKPNTPTAIFYDPDSADDIDDDDPDEDLDI